MSAIAQVMLYRPVVGPMTTPISATTVVHAMGTGSDGYTTYVEQIMSAAPTNTLQGPQPFSEDGPGLGLTGAPAPLS